MSGAKNKTQYDLIGCSILNHRVGKNEMLRAVPQRSDNFKDPLFTCQNRLDGLIVPPLPARTCVDPAAAEAESKRLLGDSANQMRPDDFEREARALDKYLQVRIRLCNGSLDCCNSTWWFASQ